MDKLKQWQNQIVGLVALAILVAGFVAAPEERLDKVGHALVAFGSTTAGQAIYAAAGALLVAAFRWALARIPQPDSRPQRIPPGAGALLLALALGASVSGCGASAPVVVAGVETGIQWTCMGARKICEWTAADPAAPPPPEPSFHDRACAVIDDVCGVVAPGSKP